MPAIEAMACSRPVVATSVGGAPEAVNSGVNGLLVGPGDADGISSCIIRILESERSSKKMGQLARETVMVRYSWESIAKKLLDLYAKA